MFHKFWHITDVPQSPYPMMIGSITAISVSLSWISAENGGFDQTFTVSYKEENDSVWQTIPGIDDPGIGMMIVYTVQNLKPETVYAFHVTARNILGSSPEQLVNFNKTLGNYFINRVIILFVPYDNIIITILCNIYLCFITLNYSLLELFL